MISPYKRGKEADKAFSDLLWCLAGIVVLIIYLIEVASTA